MRPIMEKIVAGSILAILLFLAAWARAIDLRMVVLEAQRDAMTGNIEVIREDVRELRRRLIGDVP